MPLRSVDENQFGELTKQGDDKANERTIMLTPNFPLPKITAGDYVCLPWGVRPNTWLPPGAPNTLGPSIWIDTPTGPQRLDWQVTRYVGDTLTLELVGGEWCLSGEVDFCFEDGTFSCQEFPEEYSFLKSTGPLAYFKILRLNVKEDLQGRISHYNLRVEYVDQKFQYLQA